MSSSLREQLLKAGLVSEADVRRASQPPPRHSKRRPEPVAEGARSARDAQAAKNARDLELNRKQREKSERKARSAEIDQWIEQNRVTLPDSDEYFSFVDHRKIGRVAVDATLRERLARGELAVVRARGRYAVVPEETAAKIRERIPERVVGATPSQAAAQTADRRAPDALAADHGDDPYRDFPVPDDLIW